jgi:hypothetical protein
MNANKLDLNAIRKRAEGASRGPWAVGGHNDMVYAEGEYLPIAYDLFDEADAEFIAASRQDVPALIAEVERLRKSRDWYDENLYSAMNRSTTYFDEMKRLEEKCKLYESLAQEYDYYAIIEAIEEDE